MFKISTIIPSSSRQDIVWIIFSASTLLYEKMWWSWEVLMYSLKKIDPNWALLKTKVLFQFPSFTWQSLNFRKTWGSVYVTGDLIDTFFIVAVDWNSTWKYWRKKTTESEQHQQKITGARTFFWHYHLFSTFTQWKIRITAFIGPHFGISHLTTCVLHCSKWRYNCCECMMGFQWYHPEPGDQGE